MWDKIKKMKKKFKFFNCPRFVNPGMIVVYNGTIVAVIHVNTELVWDPNNKKYAL